MAKDYSDFSRARNFEPRELVDEDGNEIIERKAEYGMYMLYTHFGIKDIDEFHQEMAKIPTLEELSASILESALFVHKVLNGELEVS
ncbi:hypothetical protein [Halonatronum saccharophilum]|uniref:hypothetical protein n=1 Tax=Halonatronum saccharophilum TaxID=150060 RepID=UPI0004887576|nr:hypothetical protein [Halonatronum saccharophilum]